MVEVVQVWQLLAFIPIPLEEVSTLYALLEDLPLWTPPIEQRMYHVWKYKSIDVLVMFSLVSALGRSLKNQSFMDFSEYHRVLFIGEV